MNSEFIVAVHAMVFLHHKADTLSSETLAENVCTNPVRIRRVLAKLKRPDWLKLAKAEQPVDIHIKRLGK